MRVYWGLVGSDTARFTSFVRGPGAVLDYARKLHRRDASHGGGVVANVDNRQQAIAGRDFHGRSVQRLAGPRLSAQQARALGHDLRRRS